jgi:transcriptional regulator with XRE-family HTH domain
MTQQQLAERSGTARSWIARVESGHRNAELEQLLRLLNALDLTMRLHARAELPEAEAEESRPEEDLNGWASYSDGRFVQGRASRRASWAASKGAADRLRSAAGRASSARDDGAKR